ncbi:MAG: tRNA guanosine(34) transglycosylase Tgt [Planctomycetes bacterium]|nr:tRNA guanosine(34) transglycosylase Tgt [Planctomycetota bacterium]
MEGGPFRIRARCGRARSAVLETAHGPVETPAFLPVATQGTVKGLGPVELEETGTRILLANAYHLAIRPGVEAIAACGGLHRFMGWDGAILTDSGGYQVYSLGKLRKIADEGITFRSHIDGAPLFLTPERALEIQIALGADCVVTLDECPPASAPPDAARRAAIRTIEWARRSRRIETARGILVFGIVQGGLDRSLRIHTASETAAIGFDGHAIGGLSVGEDAATRSEIVDATAQALPEDRPRYLMGIGEPREIVDAVAAGIDLFDCTMPTLLGHTGTLLCDGGRIALQRAEFREDFQPPVPGCACPTCRVHTRAYLRHLIKRREILGSVLGALHNVFYMQDLMRRIRAAIGAGTMEDLRAAIASPRDPV